MKEPSMKISNLSSPPAGVMLTQSQTTQNEIAIITVAVLTALVFLIRIVHEIRSHSRLRSDGQIMLAAMPLLGAFFATYFIGTHYGLGKHVWVATTEGLMIMKKTLFASLVIYTFQLCMIKLSLLAFYRRVFGMNYLNWLATVLVISWTIGSTVALLTAPDPISYFWNETVDASGGHYRYDFYNYYIVNAATNVVCDFIVIVVPIPVIWRLEMRRAQKIAVSMVLCLGCFVFAASIVRIHYLTRLQGEGLVDMTWTMAPICLWSTIEPCFSVIAACLLAMPRVVQWALWLEHRVNKRKEIPHHNAGQSCNEMDQRLGPFNYSTQNGKDNLVRLFPSVARVEADPPSSGSAFSKLTELDQHLGPYYMCVKHEIEWKVDHKPGC